MIHSSDQYCQLTRVYCQHKMQQLRVVWVIYLGFVCSSLCAKDYSIEDYGAIGDGYTINTLAIQAAIDEATSNGGGRVIIPGGRFVSGTIFLKTKVELHLTKNAVLLGSLSPADYRRVAKWKALIQANEVNDVTISGLGTIDGRGARLALKIDSLFYAGEIDSVHYNLAEKRPKWNIRPQLLHSYTCENIRINGVTFKNAACWVQTYERCNGIEIKGVKVDSDTYWNNDGIDIVDSKNVRITQCAINAADDGICIKSEDWTRKYFCDSIYVADCRVRSSASAIKFGTSTVSHIRNVIVRNIKVYDTYRSAIAIEAMQGGILENILVENIVAHNTGNAIFLRVGQIRGAKLPGTLKNITLRRIKVTVPFRRPDYAYEMRGPTLPYFHNVFPSSITGISGSPIQNITLEDITILYPGRGNAAYAHMPTHRIGDVPELPYTYPEFSMFGELPAWGFYVRHVEGLTMKNVNIKVKKKDYRPAIVLDDVSRLYIEGLKVKGDKKPNPLFMKDVRDFTEVK